MIIEADVDPLNLPKQATGGALREGEIRSSWPSFEPLVTPQQLRDLYLWGLPLVSAFPDAYTGQNPVMTDEDQLKPFIKLAVDRVELEAQIDVLPREYAEVLAHDRNEQESFGYFKVSHSPIIEVRKMSVHSSDNVDIWTVPNDWISNANFARGQINIIPFAVSSQSGVTIPVTSPIGMGLMPSMFKQNWIEGLWQIIYTAGFAKGVPPVLNQLIGVQAALIALPLLAATYARQNSNSIGIDGLSQSMGGDGPRLFNERIKDLTETKKTLRKLIQRSVGQGFLMGTI